jgi:predicted PolB exonuclease-like 3'-5' exonuclease
MKVRIRKSNYTTDYIREEFKKAGFTLVTKEYRTNKQRLELICNKCKKKSENCWNNFSKGHNRCKECLIKSRLKEFPKKIVLRNNVYSIAEAARYLNVEYTDLRKHIYVWKTLPGPSKKLGAKMYFTEEDLQKIESMIE